MGNPIFFFKVVGEICPNLCGSVHLKLRYLFDSCAELGTDPTVLQSPDEWPLQLPVTMNFLFPASAGTEGTTATSPSWNPGRVRDFEGESWGCLHMFRAGRSDKDPSCKDTLRDHCFPLTC